MIVRIMGEGQFDVGDDQLATLNRLDQALEAAVESRDEQRFRDALSDLLQSQTQYGAVVDEQGRLQGILSVELIHDFIAPEAAATTAQA